MKIGEKIKLLRKARGLTQEELSGGFITRNMLSQIERGASLPSFATLEYLCEKLDIDAGYFFSQKDDLSSFEIKKALPKIKQALERGEYSYVIALADEYGLCSEDGLPPIAAKAHFELGKELFQKGHLRSSREEFIKCLEFSSSCQAEPIHALHAKTYLEVIEKAFDPSHRISSAWDTKRESSEGSVPIFESEDFKIYSLLLNLIDDSLADKASAIYDAVKIENELFRLHINARLAFARFNYQRSKELLLEILEKAPKDASDPFFLSIYLDLENVCKALSDFEGAYRASDMRNRYLSIMNK